MNFKMILFRRYFYVSLMAAFLMGVSQVSLSQQSDSDGPVLEFLPAIIAGTVNTIEVATTSPTNITLDSATLTASLISGENVGVWFVLSTANGSQPECGVAPTDAFVGSVQNNQAIAVVQDTIDLEPASTYRYQACAQDDSTEGDITLGVSIAFTTDTPPPR